MVGTRRQYLPLDSFDYTACFKENSEFLCRFNQNSIYVVGLGAGSKIWSRKELYLAWTERKKNHFARESVVSRLIQ